ncbi:hypothetical protein EVAR_90586_1 [Eumeta japonica]|uniref:Uncharacterized protein n=1 Tax=Eumeta variegata TaxID=151549 RepID=A0A4C2A053_EUMVA|nr:hypothetical protein EVAR_90586_1 [Eumeta japonica]
METHLRYPAEGAASESSVAPKTKRRPSKPTINTWRIDNAQTEEALISSTSYAIRTRSCGSSQHSSTKQESSSDV